MRKHMDSYDLEELVLRVFLKHVKVNKLYVPFRWSVNHQGGALRDIFHVISYRMDNGIYRSAWENHKNPFGNSNSFNDMIVAMRECNGNKKLMVTNDGKFQLAVMHMVNNLIHCCIEKRIAEKGDMKFLEQFGASVFKEVCHKLFGDSFVDKTEESFDPRQKEFLTKMAEMGGMPPIEHLDRDFFETMRREMEKRRRRGEMPPPPRENNMNGMPWDHRYHLPEDYPWEIEEDNIELDWS